LARGIQAEKDLEKARMDSVIGVFMSGRVLQPSKPLKKQKNLV
jgi:hypothetical protein